MELEAFKFNEENISNIEVEEQEEENKSGSRLSFSHDQWNSNVEIALDLLSFAATRLL